MLALVWQCRVKVFAADTGEVHRDDPDDPMRTAIRQVMGVFSELDHSMVAKRLRDGRLAKAAAGRKAVGDYPFGYGAMGKGRERDGRGRLSRKPGLGSSSCVVPAGPTVRLPQHSMQRGTSPAGPPRGRPRPCATSRFGRSTTDRAPGRAVARSPKRGAGTSSPVSKTPVAAGLRLAPDATVSDAESPFPPCEVS